MHAPIRRYGRRVKWKREKPFAAESRDFGNDHLKAQLMGTFGESSNLLFPIACFIVFGAFIYILLAVFDQAVE